MFVLGLIALIVLSLPISSSRWSPFSPLGAARCGLRPARPWAPSCLPCLFPSSAATYVVLYYDLRVRRENLDLDVRVQQLEFETSGPEEAQT